VTMVLTPIVSGLTPRIYARFAGGSTREPLDAANLPDAGLSNHVVVAGGGRVGRTIAEALTAQQLPCVLIELDDRRATEAREARLPVIYGDASHPIVLEAARLQRARALIVTVPVYPGVRAIVAAAWRIRPDLPIVARADGPDAVRDLHALGIEEVVS